MSKSHNLTPDQQNANRGTERGRHMLETSLRKLGAGRSILLDKHGNVIAGNKTLEVANEIGLEDVQIVQSDGRRLIAVQRTDLDLTDPTGKARQLAYADNRVGEVDLDFDPEQVSLDLDLGLDISDWWFDDELAGLQKSAAIEFTYGDTEGDRGLNTRPKSISPVIPIGDIATIEKALRATGEKNRGTAFVKLCKAYLNEEGQFDFSLEV